MAKVAVWEEVSGILLEDQLVVVFQSLEVELPTQVWAWASGISNPININNIPRIMDGYKKVVPPMEKWLFIFSPNE